MTITGALCDDLVALQTGFVLPLPKVDASGRQLLFYVPARHNREGYTSESMVRILTAMYYDYCFLTSLTITFLMPTVIVAGILVHYGSGFKS